MKVRAAPGPSRSLARVWVSRVRRGRGVWGHEHERTANEHACASRMRAQAQAHRSSPDLPKLPNSYKNIHNCNITATSMCAYVRVQRMPKPGAKQRQDGSPTHTRIRPENK
eukprot:scaffold5668_cov111-Isochrysis_galbana.AAC.13